MRKHGSASKRCPPRSSRRCSTGRSRGSRTALTRASTWRLLRTSLTCRPRKATGRTREADDVVSPRALIVGTRGSRLALRQTESALAALHMAVPDASFEVQTIRTAGDRSAASLSEIGGRGVFVIELERALLEREIDIAVHSLKDLPVEETAGLAIAAVLAREDPRDALVSRRGALLADLPAGAVVGTGRPRPAAPLAALRGGPRISDIRGNVD